MPATLAAPFTFAFNGCDGFVFQTPQNNNPVGQEDATEYHTLRIQFPSGEILTFKDANNTYPDTADFTSDGTTFGNTSSRILAELGEWGFDEDTPWYNCDIEQLKIDVGLYPEMFTDSDGIATAFSYDLFPSVIYKVTHGIEYVASGQDPNTGDVLTWEGDSFPYSKISTEYYMSTCALDACLMEKIDDYFETRCEQSTPCEKFQENRHMLMDIIILKDSAQVNFDDGEYDNANKKLLGAAALCATGICTYKHGC